MSRLLKYTASNICQIIKERLKKETILIIFLNAELRMENEMKEYWEG